MKTIHDLNQRWWYRLTKVAFLGLLLIAIVASIISIFQEFQPIFDSHTSYIECLANGKRMTLEETGNTMFSPFVYSVDDKFFQGLCPSYTGGGFNLAKYGVVEKNYIFVAKYTPREWSQIIFYSVLSICGVFLIAEISRRIFYYIVLGSIRPSKSRE